MRVLDPGHLYRPDCYPSKEEQEVRQFHNAIQFRKRIGEGYPGNTGEPTDGTSTQELFRIAIDRAKYVHCQSPHRANTTVIALARTAIYELEYRAAERRGPEYLEQWPRDYCSAVGPVLGKFIEDLHACTTCGHILCRRHEK